MRRNCLHDGRMDNAGGIALTKPSIEANVSWNVQWSHPLGRTKIRDAATGFAGDFIQNMAQTAWTGKTDTAEFVADPASTSVNEFSLLAHERNGVFFP